MREQVLKELQPCFPCNKQMVAPHALKRLAQPSEIAAAAVYLASDEAAFVTGSALVVDGGYMAGK
jgi:NAD(P)-dependent dehydrogenase (short-subunit alcohol dehydrogenase family)